MKIVINEIQDIAETEIIINCKQMNLEVVNLVTQLNTFGSKLAGVIDGQMYIINPKDVLYIDSADKKSFIYSEQKVYESPLRLYEIEEKLINDGFVRISKSAIANLWQVKSLRPDFGARLILTMNNDERIVVSRQYTQTIKTKLGI